MPPPLSLRLWPLPLSDYPLNPGNTLLLSFLTLYFYNLTYLKFALKLKLIPLILSLKAWRAKCLDCCGESFKEVKPWEITDYPLFP
jgi:hypothetical protein